MNSCLIKVFFFFLTLVENAIEEERNDDQNAIEKECSGDKNDRVYKKKGKLNDRVCKKKGKQKAKRQHLT